MRVSVICNAIASMITWLAFSFSISSVANNTWHRQGGVNYGLWFVCLPGGVLCLSVEGTKQDISEFYRKGMIKIVVKGEQPQNMWENFTFKE